MDKQIIGMGIEHFPFQRGQVNLYSSSDRKSLMDGDVILFSPKIFSYSFHDEHKGKPLLTQGQSRIFRNEIRYWKSEFQPAMLEKKTIFIFCEQPPEFYYYESEFDESGNEHELNEICFFDPFSKLLFLRNSRITSGQEIRYFNKKTILKPLWDDFKKYFNYKIAFTYFPGDVHFVPKNFDSKRKSEVFGGIIKTSSGGFLVVLPALNFQHPDLVEYKSYSPSPFVGGETYKTNKKEAYQLSNQLI